MSRSLSSVQGLTEEHKVGEFACGRRELDEWLRSYALDSDRRDVARTFVVCRGERRVVGYYSLTMGAVRMTDAPKKLVRGLPNYPIGMVLLARLAVDREEQGTGLGAELLADALVRAVHAGESAAARLVVVDAIDEQAAAFYRRFGFLPAPEQSLRLFRRIKDIRASIEQARHVESGQVKKWA
ncbi:MAG: GNAT family N-acetyltransferase [Streptosporangiales bacterium]|nr:GNAT family N-acetyltransferase [Streptosporangiales bacterium]